MYYFDIGIIMGLKDINNLVGLGAMIRHVTGTCVRVRVLILLFYVLCNSATNYVDLVN